MKKVKISSAVFSMMFFQYYKLNVVFYEGFKKASMQVKKQELEKKKEDLILALKSLTGFHQQDFDFKIIDCGNFCLINFNTTF